MKKKNSRFVIIGLAISCSFALLQGGCSLFIGNVKPIEEKSDKYGILDLSKINSAWVRLDPKMPQSESGISDVVFQLHGTGSIISLNSACKSYNTAEQRTL